MTNTKKTLSALLALLALTLGAPRSRAQCEYATASSYTTYSVTDSMIYTSVYTEGQVVCSYNGMEHTYYATNTLYDEKTKSSAGYTESAGPSANYTEVENNQDMPISPGDIVDFSYQSEVYCPIMGYFYDVASLLKMEITITNYKLASTVTDCEVSGVPTCIECTYDLNCPQGNGTCGLPYSTLTPQPPNLITMPCGNYLKVLNIYFPNVGYCLYDVWSKQVPQAVPCT
jgi:hypothetical protein